MGAQAPSMNISGVYNKAGRLPSVKTEWSSEEHIFWVGWGGGGLTLDFATVCFIFLREYIAALG